jgi:glutaredoxin 2
MFGLKQIRLTKQIFDDCDDDTNAAVVPHKNVPS